MIQQTQENFSKPTEKKATGKNLKTPHQLEKFIENDEKFDIIENNKEKIKEYILNKIK